ncbi:MAG: hypothetical protein HY786_04440 [Deltaproteobacteria bacterium]|nr:hypothetical protein [Deltaproteobacteria bacterium]
MNEIRQKKLALFIAALLAIGGLSFSLIMPAQTLYTYWSGTQNELRHEYFLVIFYSLLISDVFWCLVALCLGFAKTLISKRILWAGIAPALVLTSGFALMGLFTISMIIIQKL